MYGQCDVYSGTVDVYIDYCYHVLPNSAKWFVCDTPVLPGHPQENKLEGLIIDEWRGASSGVPDIICDAVGNVCPWSIANGTNAVDWNISVAAAVLMVRS